MAQFYVENSKVKSLDLFISPPSKKSLHLFSFAYFFLQVKMDYINTVITQDVLRRLLKKQAVHTKYKKCLSNA